MKAIQRWPLLARLGLSAPCSVFNRLSGLEMFYLRPICAACLPAGLPGQGKKRPSVDVQGNVYESSVADQISLESGFFFCLKKFFIF